MGDPLPVNRAGRYGDRIVNTITWQRSAPHLHWNCKAKNAVTRRPGQRRQGDARLRTHQRDGR